MNGSPAVKPYRLMPVLKVAAGDQENKVYMKVVQGINSRFNIKEWSDLEKGKVADYSGMRWHQNEEGVTVNIDKYMKGTAEMKVKNKADLEEKLDDDGVQAFRSGLARVRWPASHVVLELAYGVSLLAQTSPPSLNWDQAIEPGGEGLEES